MKKKRVTIYLTERYHNILKERAKIYDRTVSNYISWILSEESKLNVKDMYLSEKK
jgi:hypothetical protein